VEATKIKMEKSKPEEKNGKTEVPSSENIRSPVKKEVARLGTQTETSAKSRVAAKVNNESNAYNDDNRSERGMEENCDCSGCIIC